MTTSLGTGIPSGYEYVSTTEDDRGFHPSIEVRASGEHLRMELYVAADGSSYQMVRLATSHRLVDELFYDPGGKLHRLDGPALITYFVEAQVVYSREFYVRGKQHRTGGQPASTFYDESGAVVREEWFVQGYPSRLDGPAVFERNAGAIRWAAGGTTGGDDGDVAGGLSLLSKEGVLTEIEHSAFAPLLTEGVTVSEIVRGIEERIRTVEGMRLLFSGTPPEWVRAWESGSS